MERRGAHATGMAVFSERESFICKSAVPAHVAIPSKPWQEAIGRIDDKTTIVLGHTRHSTFASNTKLDEGAHPFHIGKVVGAHNGIIHNWRDIFNEFGNKQKSPWIVDSQAAIGILDAVKDPAKALALLDGYWALSWVKGDLLYFTRTPEAPLAMAYVGDMRTLFWASEMSALTAVLQRANVGPYSAWETGPNALYRLDTKDFVANGPHMKQIHVDFAGRKGRATHSQITATSGGKQRRVVQQGISHEELVALVKRHADIIDELRDELESVRSELDILNQVAGIVDDDKLQQELDLEAELRISK